MGLLVGSFLNVVVHRVPLRESVALPGSHCPGCGAKIRARDNVPLLSYVLLGGRCRDCGVRIPVRYPLVEATTGALFAVAAYEFSGVNLVAALVFLAVLVALSATDLGHRLLPNAIVFPAAVAGFALSVLANPGGWWVYTASAVAVGGGLFALAFLYPGGMGMGDAKMGAMLGIFLGPYAAIAVFFGAFLGAVVSGLLMTLGLVGRRYPMPFGVFMAVGGVVALFFGQELWEAYLGLVGRS